MKYAYLDNTPSQILHVTNLLETAKESTGGKIVETEIANEFGFPVVEKDTYFYYHDTQECFKDENRGEKGAVKVEVPKEIADIVAQLV